MTPQDLIAAFDTLTEAPDGITRLRELVLQLAVRGKLVPQDAEDEPASVQLERVKSDDSWRIPARPRRGKLDPIIEGLAGEMEPPDGWVEVRFEEVIQLINGRAYKRAELLDAGTPIIRIQNLNGGTSWYYSDLELPEHQYCSKGDLLFAWSASFGPYIWWEDRSIFHYHIWKLNLSQVVARRFLFYVLKNLTDAVRAQSHGLAMLHMTKGKMERWPLLLPPLPEQHRIVARIDELMGLLDRLEAARTARGTTRAAARDAALAALREADTPEEVEVAWNRFAEQMGELLCEPADIDPVRQAVLQLAVRGKLVPQDAEDEPASVLLERITAEKARLVSEQKIRKPKALPPVSEDEVPFEVPEGWAWARTQDLVTVLDPNPSHRYPAYVPNGVPLLSTREFDGVEGWDTGTAKKMVPELFWEFQRDLVGFSPNDIVFARKGRLGLARLAPAGQRFTFSHTVFVVKVHSDSVPRCVLWFLRPDSVVRWLLDEMNANTGVPTLGKAVLERMPLPVPPLPEQHRIVARVDELMGLLDRLEVRLTAAQAAHGSFASAAVHHLDA